MASIKTLNSNINSLVHNGIMTQDEANRYRRRLSKAQERADQELRVTELTSQLVSFVTPGVQYSISDLVLNVMNIKAPCHGYKETKEEQKHRDSVAKPLMKKAIESLGDRVQVHGSGSRTKYSFETPVSK